MEVSNTVLLCHGLAAFQDLLHNCHPGDFLPFSVASHSYLQVYFIDLVKDISSVFLKKIYVLEGEVEIKYGKETYQLKAGDSIYYESIVAHHVHSFGSEKAKILAIVYTPA